MDCSPPGSSVHGISQARILERVSIAFSKGSSQPRDQTLISCTGRRFFASEPPGNPDRLVTIPLFVHYPPAPSPFSLSVSLSCVVSLVLSLTHGPIHTFLIRWLCFGRGWRSGEQLLEVRNPRGWPWPCCSGISNLQQLFPPPPASSETQPLDKKSSARF